MMDMADEVFRVRSCLRKGRKFVKEKALNLKALLHRFFFSGKKDVSAILSVGFGFKRC